MVNIDEFLEEDLLDFIDIGKGQIGIVKLPVLHFLVNHSGDELFQIFISPFLHASGGGFNAVGEHDHGGFTGAGQGARIGKILIVDRLSRVVLLLLQVKIFGFGGAVVGGDELDDAFREFVFLGCPDAIPDMVNDDFGAFDIAHLVMGVHADLLVFNEKGGLCCFADVMVKGTCPDQKGIASDFQDDLLRQVGNLHGVLERAGGLFGQFAQ